MREKIPFRSGSLARSKSTAKPSAPTTADRKAVHCDHEAPLVEAVY